MTISNIQKRKFLENLYRLLYSTGVSNTDTVVRQPTEEQIKKEFDEYFSNNRIGSPLAVDINQLRNTKKTDPDMMNFMMARSLLNVEVLYDSVFENTEDIMKVITILNKRIADLKQKRISLERKVDDILFSISNTDGYFYSFSDSFSSLKNIDLNLTSAFVDTKNKRVSLPTLKSAALDFNAPGRVSLGNITYDLIFNGTTIMQGRQLTDSDGELVVNNLFDGLENTSCTIEYSSDTIGSCAVVLTIPVNTAFVMSKVEGRLSTASPVTTIVELIDSLNAQNSQFRRQQSNSDYDTFCFDFSPQNSGVIRLTLIKHEADLMDVSANKKYLYRFDIRDLIVSGEYYDSNATLVSSPISIPAGDSNKVIDSVSISAENKNPEVGQINFFVAENVPDAKNVSDFNWIPISSETSNLSSFDQIVSFNKSQKLFKDIKDVESNNSILLYPIASEDNLSTKNPSTSVYNGMSVYRVGKISEEDNPFNSYILDGINSFSFNYVSYVPNLYKDINRWSSIINDENESIQVFTPNNIQITNVPSIPIELNLNGVSAYLKTSIFVEEDTEVRTTISRTGNAINWNMAVYLNEGTSGSNTVELTSGNPSKDITWSFKKGINNIVITFDSEGTASGSISLMSGVSITKYGTPFLNYYTYVDPFDFRVNRSENEKVFTIDKYLGNKEILCRKQIGNNSRLVYQNNMISPIESIRFRADFTRGNSPFATPSLNNYRIKFKNSI
jgi:hypothetical protein